ncbi:MAG: NAD-dependent epimerase/dehydratase [Verrucomicrobia bacterium]|jgi:UDP-glucose 4-epimerase|nr:NAD-dependent epimerase/dehydratase [Verrucomicrobiota bacterium]
MKNTRGRVVVTGGAGFIGSHLVERLLAAGESVLVIDDVSTGRWENLDAVKDHPRLTVIESRVSVLSDLENHVAESKQVFHLAAAVGVELVVKSPIYTIENNLRETEAILAAASKNSTPVLVASTSEVYGKSSKAEFSEQDDLTIGPPHLGRWSYACSKLMDEFLALAYHKEKQLPAAVVRLFNTVGPRQTGRYGMVLPRFIAAAKAGRPIEVYGNGEQTRCFCFVGDTVEALLRLSQTPAAIGEVVNIGNTEEISIHELARRTIQLLGSPSEIVLKPYNEVYPTGFEDMLRRKPSIQKLENLTGFRPTTPLSKIIQATAETI